MAQYEHKQDIPLWRKSNLSIKEGAAYFNIGEGTLRRIARDPNCKFCLMVKDKILIRRRKFEHYLDHVIRI